MLILDGKKARDFYAQMLAAKIRNLGFSPRLAIIQVGDNLSSTSYINQKKKFGEKIGAEVVCVKFPTSISFEELKKEISTLNEEKNIHGIIVQLPLPEHIDKISLINLISPKKDVDGLTSQSPFTPATARGIKSLLDFYKIEVKDKEIAVLGRSMLVGAPTAKLLESFGAYVAVCHSKTENTREITRNSDIIIVAVGKARLVDETYIGKNKPVIVDVGLSSHDGKLKGDVNFDRVGGIVSAITPVPGGVGPMTVLSLFENLVLAAEKE